MPTIVSLLQARAIVDKIASVHAIFYLICISVLLANMFVCSMRLRISYLPAVALLFTMTDLPESHLINTTTMMLLQISVEALARALRKRMPPRLSCTWSMVLLAVRAIPIVGISMLSYDLDIEYWPYLLPLGYLFLAAAAVFGVKRLDWRRSRASPHGFLQGPLQELIWDIFFALFDTMFWGITRELASVLLVSDWCRKISFLLLVAIGPLGRDRWRLWLGGVCGLYMAVDVERSHRQLYKSSFRGLSANNTTQLARRFDRATSNAFGSAVLGAVLASIVAVALKCLDNRINRETPPSPAPTSQSAPDTQPVQTPEQQGIELAVGVGESPGEREPERFELAA